MKVRTIPPYRNYSQIAVSKHNLFHIKNTPFSFLKSEIMVGTVKEG